MVWLDEKSMCVLFDGVSTCEGEQAPALSNIDRRHIWGNCTQIVDDQKNRGIEVKYTRTYNFLR